MARHKKYPNMTTFQFRLPTPVKEKLIEISLEASRDMSDIALVGLLKELTQLENEKARANVVKSLNDPNDPFGEILRNEIDTNPDLRRIKEKVLSEQAIDKQPNKNAYSFTLPILDSEEFDRLSSEYGFEKPSYLAKELATQAARNPGKVKGFIYGELKKREKEAA